jgi:hypothetical protein
MIWKEIIIITVMVLISLLIFYAIKTYILPRVKIKKGYVLILMVLLITLPAFLGKLYNYVIVQYTLMLAVSLTMLIYIELVRVDKEKKNKPVIGRPKPKKLNMQNPNDKK